MRTLHKFKVFSLIMISLAAVAADSVAPPAFQIRAVADRPSADSEEMVLVDTTGGEQTLHVLKEILMDQAGVKSAKFVRGQFGIPQIEIQFTDEGRKRFAEVTRGSMGRRLAFILDGRLYSAPKVLAEISDGTAIIQGRFSEQEANRSVSRMTEPPPQEKQPERLRAMPEGTSVIASVLGRDIRANEQKEMRAIIAGALVQEYIRAHALEPTPAECAPFLEYIDRMKERNAAEWQAKQRDLRQQLASGNLSDEQRKELRASLDHVETLLKNDARRREEEARNPEQTRMMNEHVAMRVVQDWKLNQALYRQYGGRIIFQQAGSEPLDAYRDFLWDQEKAGAFHILAPQYEGSFWNYFTNDTIHTFYPRENAATLMNTPWWLKEPPPEKPIVPPSTDPAAQTSSPVTEGEFAHSLVQAMNLSRFLPASPSDQECFELLTQRGVIPKAGWNSTNVVTLGMLSRVIVQALGRQSYVENPEDDRSWIHYVKAYGVDTRTIGAALEHVAKALKNPNPGGMHELQNP